MGYIYMITNLVNKKRYIGQTSVKYASVRWGNHRSSAKKVKKHPLYYSMNKYGLENFEFKVILKNVPDDLLNHYEIIWIDKFNTLLPNGYNIVKGGISLKGRDNPMYGKTPWNKGRRLTKEEKDNLSNKFTYERRKEQRALMSGSNNPMYGKKSHFKNHKISSISKNIYNQPTNLRVVMIDIKTGLELICFVSLGQASKFIRENTKFTKADYSTINKVCKGINKTAYGFKWEYINT